MTEPTTDTKTQTYCPHGSLILDENGKLQPIIVGDENCRSCQCFEGKKDNQVLCQLPGSNEILKIDL